MSTTVSTSIANPIRTGGQASAGLLVVQVLEAFEVYDFNEVQTGLAVIVFGSIISFLQNAAENRGWIRAVLRTVPPTETKVLDEAVGEPENTDNGPRVGEYTLSEGETFTGEMR